MTLVAALVLALPYAAAWLAATRWLADWRLGMGVAAIACSLWAVAVSELLSLAEAFTQLAATLAWGVPALVAAAYLLRTRDELRTRVQWSWWTASPRLERTAYVVIGVCGAITLATALIAAPNNWDSMTYHLARIEMWRQLEAVTHYATHIEPQLYQPPGAELFMAQPYLISGGSDRLLASVQWLAYAECIVIGSLAARALGAAVRGQLAAALLVATIPLAILQASSTQNDLILASKLLIALTLAAVAWRHPRPATLLLLASASLGLAALTKGTGLMFGLPIGLLIAGVALRRVGVARTALLAVVGLLLVALPNVGQWARNHDTYGTFVASDHAGIENPYRVQDPRAKSLVSNLVRNATNHLDLPLDAANERMERWTVDGLDALGIDASDPKTTFLAQPFRMGPFGPHEDHAGSLLLLVFGLWAAVSTVLARRRREPGSGIQLAWLAVLTLQVLLFCWLITWQNWHVRMHLPVTVAVAVLVAVRLAARERGRLLTVVCVLAVAMAPLALLFNVTRPLIGEDSILTSSRNETRFQPRPQLREPYAEVMRRIDEAGVRRAGLITGIDDWQYPLQLDAARRGIDLEQVGQIVGPSKSYAPDWTRYPDAVICIGCQPQQQAALQTARLTPVALDHAGPREGRGDDVSTVELWLR